MKHSTNSIFNYINLGKDITRLVVFGLLFMLLTTTYGFGQTLGDRKKNPNATEESAAVISEDKSIKLQAFPNPFKHTTTIQIEAEGNYTITLTDLLGKQLFSKQSSGNVSFELGTNLEQGMYIFSIINNNNKEHIRIIKQ